MAVDLMTMKYSSSSSSSSVREQQTAMQEAATAGLRSMEHLLLNLSSPSAKPYNYSSAAEIDCREITEFTVNKFKKVISLLDRTGHARFRHGPLKTLTPHHNPNPPPPPPQPPSNSSKLSPPPVLTFDFTKPMPSTSSPPTLPKKQQQPSPSMENNTSVHSGSSTFSISPPPSNSGNSSSCCFLPQSSLTADPTVSNGKIFGPNSILSKPPLPQQQQPTSMNGCNNKNHHRVGSSSSTSSAHCHCSKRKKSRMKKTTIRVPAISPKIADIPSDEYSWRKYGQKPIKGSPYPRGYYKCSTVRGCPAKKHVERALDDPTMLIVTYESEHSHNIINSNTSTITTNNNSTVCSTNSTMVMAPHASPVVATIGPSSSSTPQAAGMPVATIVFESSR